MIEDPKAVLSVRRDFQRPSKTQIEAIAKAQTSFVADALGGRAALDLNIKPLNPDAATFCGVAVPCHAGPADNLAVFAAMDIAEPGDVIMVATDAHSATASIGDMVLAMAKNIGINAVVTDGCARDLEGIKGVGLPCFAIGVIPDSPGKRGPGTAGLDTVIGGRMVSAGDIVLGDTDGVVTVPFDRINHVIAALDGIFAKERVMEQKVKNGLTMPPEVAEILASDLVKEI